MEFVRLDGTASSLVIDARHTSIPRMVYWGPRLAKTADLAALAGLAIRPARDFALEDSARVSLLPEAWFGFFGHPGIAGAHADGTGASPIFTRNTVSAERQSCHVVLGDESTGLQLQLDIGLDPETNVATRRSTLRNSGSRPFSLHWLAAMATPLPSTCQEALLFHGGWSDEFRTTRTPLGAGMLAMENRSGRTSRENYPALVTGPAGFDDDRGAVYGFHLGWSGNHRLLIETLRCGERQVQLGELLLPGEVVLEPGGAYVSPEAYSAFAQDGLNGLSHSLHQFLRRHILPPSVAGKARPVHFNTWEAVYFRHDPPVLHELATTAAELGVERFVLDDGWFAGRDDDGSGLGDWHADRVKYPDGLRPLADHVSSLGMEFGLWVEPEMVNPDSMLYREHPDWVLAAANRPRPCARNQLVLDLTRPEVGDYLFARIDELLSAYPIAYLKWDHNRDLAPQVAADGRAATRRQTLAFYDLLDRVRAAHPGVEIETCAGGGGRIDFEVMKRTERFWPSDNNDALERQAIQRGASILFPPEVTGTHIGPDASHQTGRRLSLAFRAGTALIGHFGLEFDIRELDAAERETLAAHIAIYKRFRGLIHGGRLWRIPTTGNCGQGMIVVGEDGGEALAVISRLSGPVHESLPPVRLPGLDPDATYALNVVAPHDPRMCRWLRAAPAALLDGARIDGRSLALAGLCVPLVEPETLIVLHLRRV